MSQQTQAERVGAACGPNDPRKAAIQAHLAGQGIVAVKWFAPGALHDLDGAVRHGRIRHVIFAGLPDLLEGIWEEEIAYAQWPPDVRIEFIDPPGGDAVRAVAASWKGWRRRHRRRQAWAGLALSAIVLVLSFVLCVWLTR